MKNAFFFSKRKYYLLKWFILYFKTLNLDFLLAVHEYVRQRGLTAAELFGSWTRWPRLPDASLTQGQNPEWKPLMFLTGCQLLSFALSLSTSLSPPLTAYLLSSSVILIPLCSAVPSPLSLIYSLFPSAPVLSDPLSRRNQDWHKEGPVSLWRQLGLDQNYVTFVKGSVAQNVL